MDIEEKDVEKLKKWNDNKETKGLMMMVGTAKVRFSDAGEGPMEKSDSRRPC